MGNHDKLIHFGVYGLFTVMVCLSSNNWRIRVLLLVLVGCYGGTLEILQGQLGNRHTSLSDFWANCAGIMVGAVCWRLLEAWVRRSSGDSGDV